MRQPGYNPNGQVNLIVTGDNSWSTLRAVGFPYKTRNNMWRLVFNIVGTCTTNTNLSLVVSSVTWKATGGVGQAAAYMDAGYGTGGSVQCSSGNGNISIRMQTSSTAAAMAGDLELDSRPAFAIDYVV